MKQTLFTILSALFFGMSAYSQATVSTVVDSSAYGFTDDLIFDASGNLYCADYSGDAIFKRTPSGVISVFASGMNTPNGLAFDSGGNLFVCDNVGNAIYKLSSTGVYLDTFQVNYPSGMIKDAASDTLIFTTYGAQSELKKLAPDGTISVFHSGGSLNGPVGLAYCLGELYVANFSNREIYRVESDTLMFIAQLPGSGSLGFLAEVGDKLMATAFNGHDIYSVDPITQSVQLYAGGILGSADGPISDARFTTPNGIVANATADTIYISEYSSKKLRMITGFTLGSNEIVNDLVIDIYPNPATELIMVSVEAKDFPYSIRIVDAQGKTAQEMTDIVDSKLEINVSDLEAGTFMVIVESARGAITERIVKLN